MFLQCHTFSFCGKDFHRFHQNSLVLKKKTKQKPKQNSHNCGSQLEYFFLNLKLKKKFQCEKNQISA